MRSVLLILAKDLRLRLRDRSAVMMAIVAPFGLAFILNMVIGGANQLTLDYGIVDEDHGELPEMLRLGLEDSDFLDMDLTTGLTEEEAVDLIDRGRLDAVFVFPPGFSEAATSAGAGQGGDGSQPNQGSGDPNQEAQLTVIGNVDAPIGTMVASSIADELAYRVNAVQLSVATSLADDPGLVTQLQELIDEAAQQASPVALGPLATDDRQLDETTHLMAGMSVMFLFFTVLFGIMGMFEERDQGTLPRLQAAPIRRGGIVLAKALTSVVLGLGAMVVLVTASTFLMGASWGDPLAVAVLSVAAVLAAVSIMGVVAALANKAEQAFAVQGGIAMVLAIVGGSFFPVAQGDGWLAKASELTPHYWFLRGLGDGQVGGVTDVVMPLSALLGFAAVFGTTSMVLLRTRRAEL